MKDRAGRPDGLQYIACMAGSLSAGLRVAPDLFRAEVRIRKHITRGTGVMWAKPLTLGCEAEGDGYIDGSSARICRSNQACALGRRLSAQLSPVRTCLIPRSLNQLTADSSR